MNKLGQQIAAMVANQGTKNQVKVVVGTCASIDWTAQTCTATIPSESSSTTITARMAGQVPRVGEQIWLLIVGGGAITIGRPSLPPLATVNSAASGTNVSVTGDDGVTYTAKFASGYTPASGHRVLMNWDSGPFVVVRLGGEVTPTPPTPPASSGATKSVQFLATDSGSYRGGWQGGVVYFGQSYPSAGFFYGSQIANTIPSSATITSVQIYLEVTAASGLGTMPLSLHTSGSRPGGSLALDNTVDIGAMPNGFRGQVDLPTAWGDLLKTGARLGVGTSGAGYRRLQGKSQQALAGALTIKWKE